MYFIIGVRLYFKIFFLSNLKQSQIAYFQAGTKFLSNIMVKKYIKTVW